MKNKILFFILIVNLGILHAQDIVNEGIFRIDGTATNVYFLYDYTNKTNGVHENKGNLYIRKNFTNNGTMTATDPLNGKTHFTSNTQAQEIKGTTNNAVIFKNMKLSKFVSVTLPLSVVSVADGLELRVMNSLELFIGTLKLIGDAQLVQTHTGPSQVSGVSKLYKDQQAKVPSVYRYHYWSSPVVEKNKTTYTLGKIQSSTPVGVLKDGINPLSTTSALPPEITWAVGLDGVPGSGVYPGATFVPATISKRWVYTNLNDPGDGSGWVRKTEDGDIGRGQGFSMKSTGVVPQNFTFAGTPNDGEITIPINAAPAMHLLGNPYPSALDITAFINDNLTSINGTLYFWEHTGEDDSNSSSTEGHYATGYQGGYSQRNAAMGTSARSVANTNTGIFDWETATVTSNIATQLKTITIESVGYDFNATVTIDEVLSTVAKVDKAGAGGTTGNVIIKSSGISPKSFKVTFDDKVDLSTIYLYDDIVSTTSQNIITITADEPNRNATVSQTLTGNAGQVFNLNWTDVTSFTITSQNPNNIVLDDMVFAKGGEVSLGNGTYHTPNQYMSVAQGFFVSALNSGGSIVFKNSQRKFKNNDYANGGTYFFKSEKKGKNESLSILKLGMNFRHNTIDYHRQIGISFKQGNTFSYDNGYDSEMFDVGNTDMFWEFNEMLNKKLIIAGVEEISDDLKIPISIILDKDQTLNIKIDEIKNINRDVFILDKLTSKYYDLSSSIKLDLEKGNYANRFYLTFRTSTLNINNNLLNIFLNVFVDNSSKEIVLQNKNNLEIEKIELFNILGQKVKQWQKIAIKLENRFRIKEMSSTFYIVKIYTNKGSMSKK